MTTIAVIGATGTAGSRVLARLKGRGVAVIEASRAQGVDLSTGRGLAEALDGVSTVIDVSNPLPEDGRSDLTATAATAARNVVGACAAQGVQRLVVAAFAGIDRPEFDGIPYAQARRAAEEIVLDGPVPATIVRSTHWHESATKPDAVVCNDGEVVAQDWLIQPIAADTVADVLVEAALGQTHIPRTVAGPQAIRLPELASKVLAARGDDRHVRAVQPVLAPLAAGALLAPDHAVVLGPDVNTWVHTRAPDTLGRVAPNGGGVNPRA